MTSESAVIVGSEKGLDGAESDATGTSLRPAASTADQPSQDTLMAFPGEQGTLTLISTFLPPFIGLNQSKAWVYHRVSRLAV